MMQDLVTEILKEMDTQLSRIGTCLSRLSEEDIWKKVRNNTNSIGNLCLHLAGNEYQHVVSGIGGRPFIRKRSEEFNAATLLSGAELLSRLRSVRRESTAVLSQIKDQDLKREIEIRYDEEDWKRMRNSPDAAEPFYFKSIQAHLIHVVVHYGYHTGQIVYMTKLLQDSEEPVTEFRH